MNKKFKCTEIEKYNFAEFCSAKLYLEWDQAFSLLEGKEVELLHTDEVVSLLFLNKKGFGLLTKSFDEKGKEKKEKKIFDFNNWR